MKNQKCAEFREARPPWGGPLPGVPFDNGYHLTSRDRNCRSIRVGCRCWHCVGRHWMRGLEHHSTRTASYGDELTRPMSWGNWQWYAVVSRNRYSVGMPCDFSCNEKPPVGGLVNNTYL